MIEDFSGEIEAMKTGDYEITRRLSTSVVNGRITGTVDETLTLPGMVHPATGSVVMRLPEGLRGRETKVIFTGVALRSSEDGGVPDRVTIDGAPFQVEVVERWAELGNFYRSIVVRAGR